MKPVKMRVVIDGIRYDTALGVLREVHEEAEGEA